MMREKSWREVVDLAEHYLAIDYTRIPLFDRQDMDRPWEYVTRIKDGNTCRGDIHTDIRIVAEHPSGLTFEWWVDLFKRKQDYNPAWLVDMDLVLSVLESLPAAVRPQFRQQLRVTADGIAKHTAETQVWVDKERQIAEALYRLSTSEVAERLAGQIEAADEVGR